MELLITQKSFISAFNKYLYAKNKNLINKIVKELKKENIQDSNKLFERILEKLDFFSFIPKNQISIFTFYLSFWESGITTYCFIGNKDIYNDDYAKNATLETINDYYNNKERFFNDDYNNIRDYIFYMYNEDYGTSINFHNYCTENAEYKFLSRFQSNYYNIKDVYSNISRFDFYVYVYLINEIAINFEDVFTSDYCYLFHNEHKDISNNSFESKHNVINFAKIKNTVFDEFNSYYKFHFDCEEIDLYDSIDENLLEDFYIKIDTKNKKNMEALSYL